MHVNKNALRSVVFFRKSEGAGTDIDQYGGTGFFVRHNESTTFLVSCRHVAEQLGISGFRIRANTNDGASEELVVTVDRWYCDDDEKIDVAITPFEVPSNWDVLPFPLSSCLSEEHRLASGIGEGDLIQIVGLFWWVPGRHKNLPVVHTGNIALTPGDERIPIKNSRGDRIDVEAYLVEAQTLKGLSGSPIFVRKPVAARPNIDAGRKMIAPKGFGAIFLLGIYQGAWDALAGDILEQDRKRHEIRVPVGMGMAVPGEKLLQVVKIYFDEVRSR